MQRMAMAIGIAPDRIYDYKGLHAAWPEVLARPAASGVRNHGIFLREPESLLFGYWKCHGEDYAADMRLIAADPETPRWWTLCSPCRVPLESRASDKHCTQLEEVFHVD